MPDRNPLLFVACFNAGEADRIVSLRMDSRTGALTRLSGTREGAENPLFVRVHPNDSFLYVADFLKETDGEKGGAVCAYAFDADTGKLRYLNRKPARGTVPCYVSIDRAGRHALCANYGDGSVSVLPIDERGHLGDASSTAKHPLPEGRKGGNAHSFIFSPDEKHALAADLGIDRVMIYHYDAGKGVITPSTPAYVETKNGAGPRHLAFHPNGRFVYCMTEYDNTLIAMSYDSKTGKLDILEALPGLPADFTEKSHGADVLVHPNGRFVYATNRGHESIVIHAVDPQTGRLKLIGHQPTKGCFPRSFALAPGERFLVVGNEKSDSLVTFSVDDKTGKLTDTGHMLQIDKPAGVTFA